MTKEGTEPLTARAEEALFPQSTVWLMTITVGVIVANIYYVQPLLADIARTFGLSVTRAGTVAMLSQAGTALGMFLFVPLGDKYERRSLIFILVLGSFVSLLLMGIAPNSVCLGCAAFAVGAFAASVHVVVPFAAHLAAPQQRGGGAELGKRRRLDLEAVPFEETGVDRDEQREIRKGAAVRQKQFSHRRGSEDLNDCVGGGARPTQVPGDDLAKTVPACSAWTRLSCGALFTRGCKYCFKKIVQVVHNQGCRRIPFCAPRDLIRARSCTAFYRAAPRACIIRLA